MPMRKVIPIATGRPFHKSRAPGSGTLVTPAECGLQSDRAGGRRMPVCGARHAAALGAPRRQSLPGQIDSMSTVAARMKCGTPDASRGCSAQGLAVGRGNSKYRDMVARLHGNAAVPGQGVTRIAGAIRVACRERLQRRGYAELSAGHSCKRVYRVADCSQRGSGRTVIAHHAGISARQQEAT